jgi:hypothetical protein
VTSWYSLVPICSEHINLRESFLGDVALYGVSVTSADAGVGLSVLSFRYRFDDLLFVIFTYCCCFYW